MSENLLANARLILPQGTCHGLIRLLDGRIAEIDPDHGAVCPAGAHDCGGDWLMPGLVELHTDNLERHLTPRPGVGWPHEAALISHDAELAGAGITTVFDALRVGSSRRAGDHYEPYARKLATELLQLRGRGALRISHYLHLRAEICSETLTEELASFDASDRVGIVSLMDHTPGQRQFRDITQYRTYMMGKAGMTESEFEAHVADRIALGERVGIEHHHIAAREARRLGAILASHDDTVVDDVAHSRAEGVVIAEFPTTFEAAEACRASAMAIMMGAPNVIRGGSHSGNVGAMKLARAGLLDVLSSDYVPGALLLAAFRLADEWDDTARAIATVTGNPARAAGFTDRGWLVSGLRADLIRVARIGRTPRVRETWVRGERVA